MPAPFRRAARVALSAWLGATAAGFAGRTVAAPSAAAAPLAVAAAADEPRAVSADEILAAMQDSRDYELTATANGPRLQAEVLLRLIAAAETKDAAHHPLLVDHEQWFQAFLARTGLPAERAPLYVRLSHDIGQDLLADYRRDSVVAKVLQGPPPRHVANVRIWWAARKPQQISYEDALAVPKLQVTQSRLITYRLVDYGDRTWYAEVHGLRGRPTSGALGALFAVVGEATVIESWSAVAPDGTQVVRGHARKWWFDRTETVTVLPNGRGDRGVPRGRPDLAALEKKLKEPLAIQFQPLPP
jgi:hypothetical protein